METANLYYQIPKPSTITQDLIDFAHQPETWAEYYNFKARMIPLDIIFSLSKLHAIKPPLNR